jgi:hypothetical protein
MSNIALEQNTVATPVCLSRWLENPYRLVSLWDMLFDAGRFGTCFLTFSPFTGFATPSLENNLFSTLSSENQKQIIAWVESAISYCRDQPFPMSVIPLERLLLLAKEDDFNLAGVAKLLQDAMERLRDEAGTLKLLRLQSERIRYYEIQQPFGLEVADRFPSATFDAQEACRCYALYRPTACVFHLMRVLEIGLWVFADRFGIPSDHTNWHAIIEGIEKAVRNMAQAPNRPSDWKDQQEFFSQAASYFMMMKDAWRNYTAHARGKYTDEEAETLINNVRGFMQKLATRLHE